MTDIALDLARHLDQRIETVLRDFMDRCAAVDVTYEEATAKAVTVLCHYFVIAAMGIDATEPEIVAACRWHYEQRKQHERSTAAECHANHVERWRVSQ